MKLIEYGWDMRNSLWVGSNTAQMESKPFDGFVFSAKLSDGSLFHDSFWSTRSVSISELSSSIGSLNTSTFTKLHERFLFIGTRPGIDWFDGFNAVIENLITACHFATETGCRGLFFDLENYGKKIFDYSKCDYTSKKNIFEYRKMVEARASEFAEVLYAYRQLELFLTFGYSQANTSNYSLLGAFLDGLNSIYNINIIDGHEDAYTEKSEAAFKALSSNKALGAYPQVSTDMHTAYGVNLEAHPSDLTTPLTAALKTTDEYVWLYSQSIDWWDAGDNARTAEVIQARKNVGI